MLDALAVIAIIGYLIYRQVAGQPLRAKMVLVLPVVLTVYGVTELTGHGHHLRATDIGLLAAGALGAVVIGAGLGALTHLEAHDGALWGKLPLRGLWLWAAAFALDAGLHVAAAGMHAQVAVSGAPLLLLGLNRLAQAAVIGARSFAAGIPFAPAGTGRIHRAQADPDSWPFPARADRDDTRGW